MSHTSLERYRQLFQYEKDTHLKVLQSLQEAAKLVGVERLQKAIDLMTHILFGRRLWLYRLGATKEAPNFQEKPRSLPELQRSVDELHKIWTKYFENLKESELVRIVDYRTTEGEPFRCSVEDILTTLIGHSIHHTGQIASLIREAGSKPAETDFIFYVREPIKN